MRLSRYLTKKNAAMAQNDPSFRIGDKLYCQFFGHKLTSLRKIATHFEEFECKTCKKQFTLDVAGGIVALTPFLKDINETIASVYLKRSISKRGHLNP
jgi:transposase-like protein